MEIAVKFPTHNSKSVLAINYRLNQILLCTYPAIHKNIFYLLATFSDNNYRPQTKFGARLCFYSRVSFCSWGGSGWSAFVGGGVPTGGSASRGGWVDPPRIRKADGTHPSGMPSCLIL